MVTQRQEYHLGAERLLDFLASEYDDSGTSRSAPDNAQFYYKLPAAFAYGGRRRFALLALKQFEQRFLVGDKLKLDPMAGQWEAYIAGWSSWGAGMLGHYDLAKRILATVIKTQNQQYGGLVSETDKGLVQDTVRSSGAAMGCVWANSIQNALLVAKFAAYAIRHQPEPNVFYTYFDLKGEAVPEDVNRLAYFALNDKDAYPAVFGTTVASLVWLGRLTGDRSHFDVAHQYMKLVLSSQYDPGKMPLATKLAWASFMLSSHVNDEALVDFAHRTGDSLLGRQKPDGSLDFDAVPDVSKPIEKVWQIGWGCDAVLTLIALGNGLD